MDGVGTDEWAQAGTIAATVENLGRGIANGLNGEDGRLEMARPDDFVPLFRRDREKPKTKADTNGIAAFEKAATAMFGGA